MTTRPLILFLAVFGIAAPAQAALVGYWNFDSEDATDLSGQANHGTVNGSAAFSSDVPLEIGSGKSIDLDGVDDFVQIAHSASLAFNDTVTVSMWIKGDPNDPSEWTRPFSKDAGWGIEVQRYGAGGTAQLRVDTSDYNNHCRTIGTLFNDTWRHLAFVIDTGSVALFLDGAKSTYEYPHGNGFGNTGPVYIGKSGQESGREFKGLIDDVAIWDHALTDWQLEGLTAGVFSPDNLPVPEPSTLLVWLLLAGLGIARGWRRK